jgi:hypothetical protein
VAAPAEPYRWEPPGFSAGCGAPEGVTAAELEEIRALYQRTIEAVAARM